MSDSNHLDRLRALRFSSPHDAVALEWLLAEHAEHEASFELYYKAEMRAIEMWHAKGGDPKVWPDKAKMTVWLLEENARLRSLADELAAALREMVKWQQGVQPLIILLRIVHDIPRLCKNPRPT